MRRKLSLGWIFPQPIRRIAGADVAAGQVDTTDEYLDRWTAVVAWTAIILCVILIPFVAITQYVTITGKVHP